MNKGFTLIEIIAVVAIMVLLSAAVSVNWRTGDQSLALDRAAHQLSQDVRGAIEMSMQAKELSPGSSCPVGSIDGYGMFFDAANSSSYLLFADCDGDHQYRPGQDALVQTIRLDDQIRIVSVSPQSSESVLFVPPEPQVFITPMDETGRIQIMLSAKNDSAKTKIIFINARGVVEIQ